MNVTFKVDVHTGLIAYFSQCCKAAAEILAPPQSVVIFPLLTLRITTTGGQGLELWNKINCSPDVCLPIINVF